MESYNHGGKPGLAAPDAPALFDLAGAASVVADAIALTELTPEKKSALVAQATQSRERNKHPNSATEACADKAFQTLRAEFALRGYGLSRTHGDDGPVCFHVNRWGMVRELRDLAAVRAALVRMGCAP